MRLDDEAHAAIDASHLRSLPLALIEPLVAEASRQRFGPGSTIVEQGTTAPHLSLVVSGLVRVYVTGPEGRTMTVRYCRPGALIGMLSLFVSPSSIPASIQAISAAELLVLRPSAVKAAADREPRVARALLDELSERVQSFIAEIRDSAFATVRQRVARHLLDLASESQRGPELVAAIGQQDLADAVGSVREVVVRALREFRQHGLVETARDRIRILDPDRLLGEAHPAGEAASREWNQSP